MWLITCDVCDHEMCLTQAQHLNAAWFYYNINHGLLYLTYALYHNTSQEVFNTVRAYKEWHISCKYQVEW